MGSGWTEADLTQNPDGTYSRKEGVPASSHQSKPSRLKYRNIPVWKSDCTPVKDIPLRLNDSKMPSTKE